MYLCGYELTQNLDFDLDSDGSTYVENPPGTYTLDSGDTATPHFVTSAGGWDPIGSIGSNTDQFTAVFDGNGFTIANMTVSRDLGAIGLFGITNNAVIRNIGLIDVLARKSGLVNSSLGTGGLVGAAFGGDITASYTTGVVISAGDNGNIGGLIGLQQNGSVIIASYSASAVRNDVGLRVRIGGLVGRTENASTSITASYATGNVDGSVGNEEYIGGLVGLRCTWRRYHCQVTPPADVRRRRRQPLTRLPDCPRRSVDVFHNKLCNGHCHYGFGVSYQRLSHYRRSITKARVGHVPLPGLLPPLRGLVPVIPHGTSENRPATGISTLTVNCRLPGATADSTCSAPMTGATDGIDSPGPILPRQHATRTSPASKDSWAHGIPSDSTCSAPPMTGATSGVDYLLGVHHSGIVVLLRLIKLVETWLTISWSNADDNTLNAWIFAAGKAPRLR